MKEKYFNILFRFITWLIVAIVICIVGMSRTCALETKTIYNSASSTGSLSGSNRYNYGYMTGGGTIGISSASVGTTIQGVSYGFNFTFYENIVLTKTYTLRINFMSDDLLPSFTSQMVRVSSCNNTACNDSGIISISKSSNSSNSTYLIITFAPTSVGTYVSVNLANNTTAITGVSNFGISSVTLDSQNVNEDIINNASQNANNIINSQNSSASNIIENQNQNTQDLIDSSASNTQDLIDSQYTCKVQTITNYEGSENVALNSAGAFTNADNFMVSDYIKLYSGKTYTLTKENWGASRAYCLYNNNKEIISCTTYGTNTSFTITGANYIRYTWSDTNNRKVSLYGDICLKDSQEQEKTNKGILKKIGELISGLFDTSGPDTDTLQGVGGWLPAGPIDSILNLPLTLYNGYTTGLNATCSDLEIPIPFLPNKTLNIPCIRTILTKINIVTFWDTFGLFLAGVLLYNYFLSLYAWYDRTTSLKSTGVTGSKNGFGGDA